MSDKKWFSGYAIIIMHMQSSGSRQVGFSFIKHPMGLKDFLVLLKLHKYLSIFYCKYH